MRFKCCIYSVASEQVSKDFSEIEEARYKPSMERSLDNAVYNIPEGADKPCEYSGDAHIGMFQDSYLVEADHGRIDLRYFPHFQNIEFYSEHTEWMPLFLENVGDVMLYAKTSVGTIKLNPGERKEVRKENAEAETPSLPNGDLYPAGIVE